MAANGGEVANGTDEEVFYRIRQALEVVHSPYSANDARRQAQDFLEELKGMPQAPLHGYNLAKEKSQIHIVRHYGLSLLEHAIRYQWSTYDPSQVSALLSWVLELSQAVSRDDPAFLRNKVAQLWVEVAKRCWGDAWMDMDARLVELWNVPDSAVHKEFVMLILESLSEEVFTGEDTVVALRESVLSKACVEIFTPTSVLLEAFPNRQAGPDVRHSHEGWLSRISQLLSLCLASDVQNNEEVKVCTLKCLTVLQVLLPWAIPKAIAAAQCVSILGQGLACPSSEVQKVQYSPRDSQSLLSYRTILTPGARAPLRSSMRSMVGLTSMTRSSANSWLLCTCTHQYNSARTSWSGRQSTPRISTMISTSF